MLLGGLGETHNKLDFLLLPLVVIVVVVVVEELGGGGIVIGGVPASGSTGRGEIVIGRRRGRGRG